jgi:hypothetical protein
MVSPFWGTTVRGAARSLKDARGGESECRRALPPRLWLLGKVAMSDAATPLPSRGAVTELEGPEPAEFGRDDTTLFKLILLTACLKTNGFAVAAACLL